ncbi:zinc finger domain-containing protein, partial [Streptomyces sp. ID01-9D]|uniref:zinc finger domain-containing protein n=1 Tax=Streptomyces sp. ID01-9D TaxID=3028659 RepID=UPI0029C4C1C7
GRERLPDLGRFRGVGDVYKRQAVRVQERLYVYGRARRPCLRCGTPVRLADQDDRPTYWCPGCQSGPTP